jgi:hypothetical protein
MSLVSLPSWFMPDSFLPRLSTVERVHSSPFGGVEQAVDMLNDRWTVSLSLPASSHGDAARIEALIASMRGSSNTIALYHFVRPAPNGTLRGSPVILTAAAQGADEIEIAGVAGETLLAGDLIGVGGLLLMVASDCTADADGVMTVPIVNRLRTAQAGLTRASTATYYDGVTTAKGDENMLLRSQEFDHASWAKLNTTVSANATTAPDGTSTAEKIEEDTATGEHRISQTITWLAAAYTASVYLKGAERGFALVDYGGAHGVTVDLSTGVASSAVGSVTSITSVAVGTWWRVSFGFNASAGAGTFRIYASTDGVYANRSYLGVLGSGIYVWGAQVEQRSSVTAYTVTTSAAVSITMNAMVSAAIDVARFDYDPVTLAANGLLIEAAATNLLTYSEEFDNAAWTKAVTVVSANAAIAPDGTLTADIFYASTVGGARAVGRAWPSSGIRTLSVFLKKQTGSGVNDVWLYNSTNNNKGAGINLTTGVVSVNDGNYSAASEAHSNGWWRFSVTTQTAFGSVGWILYTDATINVNVSGPLNGVIIWGAQCETGASETSYIKTTTATVTRAADVAGSVTWDAPTAPFRMVSKSAPQYVPGYAESVSLDFVEAIA